MKNRLILGIVPFALIGCKGNESQVQMSIGVPEIHKDFRYDLTLDELDDLKSEEIGIRSVKVVDSLLMMSHASNWTILDRGNLTKIGDVFSTGQGPAEFNYIPYVSRLSICSRNDSTYIYAPDSDNGRIMRFNLSKYLESAEEDIIPAIKTPVLHNMTLDVVMMDDKDFFFLMPDGDMTGYNRQIFTTDSIYELPQTKVLDEVKVTPGEDMNLLGHVTRYEPVTGNFVEAMIGLNQINIYSKDGKYGKTITMGKKLDDVREIEATPREKRLWTYVTASPWECGFGAVYYGHTDYDAQTGTIKDTEIQFFDWNGEPIARCRFPYFVNSFDLSLEDGLLYVVDSSEDVLRVYDGKPIMKAYSEYKSKV